MIDKRVVPMSQHEASLADSATWPRARGTTAVSPGSANAWIAGEPPLQDLLADPLLHAVLRRDGLSLQDLRRAIALGRSRLAPSTRPHGASDAA